MKTELSMEQSNQERLTQHQLKPNRSTQKSTNKTRRGIHEIFRMFTRLTFLVYSFIISYLMLFGRNINIPNSHGNQSYNLQPFKTIMLYINNFNSINLDTVIINLVGNIVVFIPLGILLPILFKRMRKFTVLFLTCTLLISIAEILQLLFRIGSLDIDDLILNLVGCIIGFMLYTTFVKLKKLITKN